MAAPDPRTVAVVAAGGVVGSLGRYAVGLALPHAPGTFPWATFLVNVSGSLAMGLLVAWLVTHPGAHRLARPFVGVGVLGGWTTFSTLAVDTVRLGDGHEQLALLYVAATFVVGILAVGLGILIGRRTWPDIAGAQEDS
ncbi:CrcB family protein [Phycicoccus sp.]|uniref:fluoride efflux transporter FluC n=1 Tax=Phycicoccus sp. TaxID=1902410 RepID=UPI00345F079F